MALLGANAAGYPYLTWATGPHGPTNTGPLSLTPATAPQAPPPPPNSADPRHEPAAFRFPPRSITPKTCSPSEWERAPNGCAASWITPRSFEILKEAL